MSFLKSLFNDKKNPPPETTVAGNDVSMDMLKALFPIRNYDNAKLLAFTSDLKSETFPEQTTLFQVGDRTDSALYLLKGTISLADENGKNYEIESGSGAARFPLSSGAIHTTTAITKTQVSVLRVSQNIMGSKQAPTSPISALVIPEELKGNRLLQSFAQYNANEELEIPSLPNIAIKLQHAMENDIGISYA